MDRTFAGTTGEMTVGSTRKSAFSTLSPHRQVVSLVTAWTNPGMGGPSETAVTAIDVENIFFS
jgi:hypothetical protein